MGGKQFKVISGIRIGEQGDYARRVFCRLTVLGAGFKLNEQTHVVCECQCGEIHVVMWPSLLKKNTQSCGCLRRDRTTEIKTTHGKSHTSEFHTWDGIKARCFNQNNPAYGDYGARGILMCDSWRNSFEQFYQDMGPKPSAKHSIERKNNDLGYSPDNCVWATRVTQNNNRRCSVLLEFYGKRRTVAEWSRISLVKRETIRERLRAGWPKKEAVWAQPGDIKMVNGKHPVPEPEPA